MLRLKVAFISPFDFSARLIDMSGIRVMRGIRVEDPPEDP